MPLMLSSEDWPRLQLADASGVDGEDRATDGEDTAAAFARCFATADGQRVLAELRRVAFDRMFGPEASEAALRHAEGQKQLVAFILSCIRRGGRDRTTINRRPGA
jgi:hypothetical protein